MPFMPSKESRDWQLRVQDILQAGQDIADFTEGLSFEDFQGNKILVQSVLYNFVIIGEAAANIPDEVKVLHPDIPWRIMADMRNVMAHEYFQVNLAVVWQTLRRSLPPVITQLENL
jgi:uncharacterized protein with HEPN domain